MSINKSCSYLWYSVLFVLTIPLFYYGITFLAELDILQRRHLRTFHSPNYYIMNYPHSPFAICAIVKDEDRYLKEWVDHHLKLGTSKIYLFDNNSTHPQNNLLKKYIHHGYIDYFSVTSDKAPNSQLYVYERCLKDFGHMHDFIGFFDADEYIIIKNENKTIPQVLKDYTKCGGLTLNWLLLGDPKHITRPKGTLSENYKKCLKAALVKTIVQPSLSIGVQSNPHSFYYKFGYYACDTSFKKVEGVGNPDFENVYKVMYLNHYSTKSREDYIEKMTRGYVNDSSQVTMDYFDSVNSQVTENCTDSVHR